MIFFFIHKFCIACIYFEASQNNIGYPKVLLDVHNSIGQIICSSSGITFNQIIDIIKHGWQLNILKSIFDIHKSNKLQTQKSNCEYTWSSSEMAPTKSGINP